MQFEQIIYEVEGTRTAIVALNRPREAQRTAVGRSARTVRGTAEADEHNAVHCVVLRGAGPHFCAGADLQRVLARVAAEAYRGRQGDR